jgi:hypothetical protein
MLALAVVTVSAQTKTMLSGKCEKPKVQQSISIPDQQGHMFTLSQGNCTAKGDIGGAKGKDGVFSERADIMGNHLKNSGVFVETMDSGDKIFYTYQSTATLKDGALVSGMNEYEISGATGKMKGIKGSGSCKLTPTSDGGTEYSCSGEYTMGGGMKK